MTRSNETWINGERVTPAEAQRWIIKLLAHNAELLKVVELLVNDTADLDIVVGMGREAIHKANLTSS